MPSIEAVPRLQRDGVGDMTVRTFYVLRTTDGWVMERNQTHWYTVMDAKQFDTRAEADAFGIGKSQRITLRIIGDPDDKNNYWFDYEAFNDL
jgi:hypothetical protein